MVLAFSDSVDPTTKAMDLDNIMIPSFNTAN